MSTTKLSVPDISCAHCERTVLATLSPIAGVSRVSVDIPAHIVTVDYDADRVSVGQLSDALAAEAYPVAAAEMVAAS